MRLAENHHFARFGPPLAVMLVVIGFYSKLVLTDKWTWLAGPDFLYQVVPWFQFQATQWHRSSFPLWDIHVWAGQTLIGQAQPGAAYPPNWLLFLLPLKEGYLHIQALHWYFVLIRVCAALAMYAFARSLGRSRCASVMSAAVYGLGGYVASIWWPQMVNAAVWLPLAWMFLLRGSPYVSATCMGIAWLTGHHTLPLFATLAWGVSLLIRHRKSLVFASLAPVFLLCSSAFQTLPALEYGRAAKRWVGGAEPIGWSERVPYSQHQTYSLSPKGLLGIFVPGMDPHFSPLIGIAAAVLALAGLIRYRSDNRVWYLTGLALFGVLVALGAYTPIHRMLYAYVPMVDKARVPAQAMGLFHLGASALVAYGIDAISRGRTLALVIALPLILFELQRGPGAQFAPMDRLNPLWGNQDLKEFLKDKGHIRAELDGDLFPVTYGDWWGIDTFSGYTASVPDTLWRQPVWEKRTQNLLGIRYYVTNKPFRDDLTLVSRTASGVPIYENPAAYPRAWAETCAGREDVRIVAYEPNRVELTADLRCKGTIILADNWFPGWSAKVDGRKAPIGRPYDMFRGVSVPEGRHAIEMRYRPWSVLLGAALTLTTVLVSVVLLVNYS